jgi:hypothetical protein
LAVKNLSIRPIDAHDKSAVPPYILSPVQKSAATGEIFDEGLKKCGSWHLSLNGDDREAASALGEVEADGYKFLDDGNVGRDMGVRNHGGKTSSGRGPFLLCGLALLNFTKRLNQNHLLPNQLT